MATNGQDLILGYLILRMKDKILEHLYCHPQATAKEMALAIFGDTKDKHLINHYIYGELKMFVDKSGFGYTLNKQGKLAYVDAFAPLWDDAVEEAKFYVSKLNQDLLRQCDIAQLQSVHNKLQKTLEGLYPIRSARNNNLLLNYGRLLFKYEELVDKINDISQSCESLIKIKKRTPRTQYIQKLKNNSRKDSSFFMEMHRLYEKLNANDFWFENESRCFRVDTDEDVEEYIKAYGRKMRGGGAAADITYEGEEDNDKWGFFELINYYVPFDLRRIKSDDNYDYYHLYTFNKTYSINDYDYDEAITDRVQLLHSKGII